MVSVFAGMMKDINPLSNARFVGRQFLHLESVDSTNSFCLADPDIMLRPGLVVYADRQLSGRGRMNRHWSQGRGGHLFASFVIHPALPADLAPSITLCAGLAVHQTLSGLGCKGLSLKWPNDVLINGRKVCGILCESRILSEKITVVAGIGINISGDVYQFPPELRSRVTTLEANGIRVDRDSLLEGVTLWFDRMLVDLHSVSRRTALFRQWEHISSSLGRMVRFKEGEQEKTGTVHGLDDFGRLMVRDVDGRLMTVVSGEVGYAD